MRIITKNEVTKEENYSREDKDVERVVTENTVTQEKILPMCPENVAKNIYSALLLIAQWEITKSTLAGVW